MLVERSFDERSRLRPVRLMVPLLTAVACVVTFSPAAAATVRPAEQPPVATVPAGVAVPPVPVAAGAVPTSGAVAAGAGPTTAGGAAGPSGAVTAGAGLAPGLLRAALIVREFDHRARARGPYSPASLARPTTMTGPQLQEIVARVATAYLGLQAGRPVPVGTAAPAAVSRLAGEQVAALAADRRSAVSGTDLDALVVRVVTAVTTPTRTDPHALTVAGTPAHPRPADPPLTDTQLRESVARVAAEWRRARPGEDLNGLSFGVGDLPGRQVGHEDGRRITVDRTAAGYGWDRSSTGGTRMNLDTVVRHEVGHAVGLEHGDGLMTETIMPGQVRPVPDEVRQPLAGHRDPPARGAGRNTHLQPGSPTTGNLVPDLTANGPAEADRNPSGHRADRRTRESPPPVLRVELAGGSLGRSDRTRDAGAPLTPAVPSVAASPFMPASPSAPDGVPAGAGYDQIRRNLDALAVRADHGRAPPTAGFEQLLDRVVGIVSAGGTPDPTLCEDLYRSFLHRWSRQLGGAAGSVRPPATGGPDPDPADVAPVPQRFVAVVDGLIPSRRPLAGVVLRGTRPITRDEAVSRFSNDEVGPARPVGYELPGRGVVGAAGRPVLATSSPSHGARSPPGDGEPVITDADSFVVLGVQLPRSDPGARAIDAARAYPHDGATVAPNGGSLDARVTRVVALRMVPTRTGATVVRGAPPRTYDTRGPPASACPNHPTVRSAPPRILRGFPFCAPPSPAATSTVPGSRTPGSVCSSCAVSPHRVSVAAVRQPPKTYVAGGTTVTPLRVHTPGVDAQRGATGHVPMSPPWPARTPTGRPGWPANFPSAWAVVHMALTRPSARRVINQAEKSPDVRR